jgi:hypothetical protein
VTRSSAEIWWVSRPLAKGSPAHHRDQARRVRVLAATAADEDIRIKLEAVAVRYEAMAATAELGRKRRIASGWTN